MRIGIPFSVEVCSSGRDCMNRSTWNTADYSLDTASQHFFANWILHSLCVPAVNAGKFPTSSDSNRKEKDVCET